MSDITSKELVVALDIGTSSTKCAIAAVDPSGHIEIIGSGEAVTHGMEKAGVTDLDSVVKSVKSAIFQAKEGADCDLKALYLNISGKHISCQNENGMVPIDGMEVTEEDIEIVLHTAQTVLIPDDRLLLHVQPQEYSLDIQDNIRNPLGMSGMRLEASVHMITASNDMARNIKKCVQRQGLEVQELVFSAFASAEAVISEDEKLLGVCVIDIGGGTTDIAIYTNGFLRHSAVISIAGNQATNDIAQMFSTPIHSAEMVKTDCGSVNTFGMDSDETIYIPTVGGHPDRTTSRQVLAQVIESRYQEIFDHVREEIERSGLEDSLAAGVVLTGGASNIDGIIELATSAFGHVPVRVGYPSQLTGAPSFSKNPSSSTLVGLIKYAASQQQKREMLQGRKEGVRELFSKLTNWIKREF